MPASLDDNREPKRDASLRYVVVEGCIGVGKTTLTHLLSERLGARRLSVIASSKPSCGVAVISEVSQVSATSDSFRVGCEIENA